MPTNNPANGGINSVEGEALEPVQPFIRTLPSRRKRLSFLLIEFQLEYM